jgi:glutamate synthase (NADPH/NADH) large chain
MSGGYAYILDLETDNLNQSAFVNGELVLSPLSTEDSELLLGILQSHADETGSAYATGLLAEWAATTSRFTKIVPRDFQNVTHIRDHALAAGLDPDGEEVWAQIMEVTGG